MSNYYPYKTNKWLHGVLNKEQMQCLIDTDYIKDSKYVNENRLTMDYSAMDLHIANDVYQLERGTIKPIKGTAYSKILNDPYYSRKIQPESDGSFKLSKNTSYIIKLKESFDPHRVKGAPIYAQATAKSSIGRLDIIVRLIIDGMGEYEGLFEPKDIADSGEMFIEVTPNTFSIKVQPGDSLSQIRFFYGKPEDCIIKGKFLNHILISPQKKDENFESDGSLSVDISPDPSVGASAFCAKVYDDFIDLNKVKEGFYSPEEFWDKVNIDTGVYTIHSLRIEVDKFYILRSKERISLPCGVAVYCKAMDETIGELRIHYAGFVHPFFGFNRDDNKEGTPLIFEVRGHNINVNLTDGEILARMIFYRMSMDEESSEGTTPYGNQELKLSKYFKKWDV